MKMSTPVGTSNNWSASSVNSPLRTHQTSRRRHSSNSRSTPFNGMPATSGKLITGLGSPTHFGGRDYCNSSLGFAHFFRNFSAPWLPPQLQQLSGGLSHAPFYPTGQSTTTSDQIGNVKVILCVQPVTSPSSSNTKASTMSPLNVEFGTNVAPSLSPNHYSLAHRQAFIPSSSSSFFTTTTTSATITGPAATAKTALRNGYPTHQHYQQQTQLTPSCLAVDARRSQVAVTNPTPSLTMRRRSTGQPVSKLFAFDAVISQSHVNMEELCAKALTDVLLAVFRGQDGCLLTIGHRHIGKTFSMLGSTESPSTLGLIPCGISWLFTLLKADKERNGTRFSVRVSAVEIMGRDEKFRDLLANVISAYDGNDDDDFADAGEDISPGHYLQKTTTPKRSMHGQPKEAETVAQRMVHLVGKQNEMRAGSAEKAAHFLDVAMRRRSDLEPGLSHMLFTLHIYRCRLKESDSGTNVQGGRTRLHFFDLGSGRYGHQRTSYAPMASTDTRPCHPRSQSANTELSGSSRYEGDANSLKKKKKNSLSNCLSLSGIGNVLLALLTGQRHLPFRDSALTYLLREAVTGAQMLQPCILAHVSANAVHYMETLQVVKLASKLNRLRRRRIGFNTGVAGPSRAGDRDRLMAKMGELEEAGSCGNAGSSSSTTAESEKVYLSSPSHRWAHRRGPRLGRLSYGGYGRLHSSLSYSSEIDFSSSSGEQSCDTVIFAGQWKRSDSRSLPLSKLLELRGTADGSVDPSDVGRRGSSMEYLPTLPKEDVTKYGEQRSPAQGKVPPRCMKRMVPRTNVFAWPRSRALRNSRHLLTSHEETWIDGPNARVVTTEATTTSAHDKSENTVSSGCQSMQMPFPEPPLPQPPSYYGYSHNLLTHRDKIDSDSQLDSQTNSNVQAIPVTLPKKDTRVKPSRDAIDLPAINRQDVTLNATSGQNGMQADGKQTQSAVVQRETVVGPSTGATNNGSGDNSSSSCSSTLENQRHRGARALSDISERTEETAETTMGERGAAEQWSSPGQSHPDSAVPPRALELPKLLTTFYCPGDGVESVPVVSVPTKPDTEERKWIHPICHRQLSPPTSQQTLASGAPSSRLIENIMHEKAELSPPEKDQKQSILAFIGKTDCSTSPCRSTDTFCWLQAQPSSPQELRTDVLTTLEDRKQRSFLLTRQNFDLTTRPANTSQANRPSSANTGRIRQDLPHQQGEKVGGKGRHLTHSLANSPQKSRATTSEMTGNSNPLVRVAAWVNSIHFANPVEAEGEGTMRSLGVSTRQPGKVRQNGEPPHGGRQDAPVASVSGDCRSGRLSYDLTGNADCGTATVNSFSRGLTCPGKSGVSSEQQGVTSVLPTNKLNVLESSNLLSYNAGNQPLDPRRPVSSIYARMRSVSADPFAANQCQPNPLTSFNPSSSINDSGLHSPASLFCKLLYRKGDYDDRHFIESGYAEPVNFSHPVSPCRPCLMPGRVDLKYPDSSTPPERFLTDWSRECLRQPQFSRPVVSNIQQTDKPVFEDPIIHVLVAPDGEHRGKSKIASKGRKFLTLPLFRSLRIRSRGSKKQTKKMKAPPNTHQDTVEEGDGNSQANVSFKNVLPYMSPLCRMEKAPPFFCSTVGTGEPVVLSMNSLRQRTVGTDQHHWINEAKQVGETPCVIPTAPSIRMMSFSGNKAATMMPGDCSVNVNQATHDGSQVLPSPRGRLNVPLTCYHSQYCNGLPDSYVLQSSDACSRCFQSALPQTFNNFSDSSSPLGGLLTSNSMGYHHHHHHNRNGRRSVTGGPASSGYESMRIGTSDLSLSHSSPSECSASSGRLPEHLLMRCHDETLAYGPRNSLRGNAISQKSVPLLKFTPRNLFETATTDTQQKNISISDNELTARLLFKMQNVNISKTATSSVKRKDLESTSRTVKK